LTSALLQFSTQADVPVTLAAHAADNLQSAGLQGRWSIRAALAQLLANSGLEVATIGDTVALVRNFSPRRASIPRLPEPAGGAEGGGK